MAGKLCVSVIEARNVQADEYAEKNFYVKLRVGGNEVKTDVVRGSSQPKFLKDCRLAVPMPESDYLRIELLQVGPRGDLVVGSDELRILTITSKGTIVHWFALKTASRNVSAELCLVLRYLSAEVNRPMSPSYAIAAREARERALEAPRTPTGPSKSAFIDLPSPATPATTVGGASTPGVSTPPPYMAGFSPAGAPQTSPANGHAMPAAAASPLAGMGAGAVASPAAVGGPAAASAPGSAAAAAAARPARRRPAPKLRTTQVPLPLAILGGIVMGALVYIWKKRPIYYEVQEDDTLCHIASCFNKKVEEVYTRNKEVLRNPSRLYPGDRLRIR